MPQTTHRRSATDLVVRLDDGRRAGVAIYGDPDGDPVVLFHGTPASRITFAFLDGVAADQGICAIAPDRPGIGLSDDLPNRGILDYPDDVAQIADALGVGRFAVAGWSGGAAYALACAATLGTRVTAASVISGLAPLDAPPGVATASVAGLGRTERAALTLTHAAPWLAKPFYRGIAEVTRRRPVLAVRALRCSMAAQDRVQMTEQQARKLTAFFVEACRQGPRGIVLDFRLLSFPWGFALEDLDLPVHVFHGSDDQTIPVAHARVFASAIPDASLTVWDGEGHLGVWRHADEVLKVLR